MALVLEEARIPYMVIGGQAVLLYGEPRLTKDIDVTLGVGLERLTEMLVLVERMQLRPLVDPDTFTRQTMVLPCGDLTSDIRVDFIFSCSPYEQQAMERVRKVQIGNAHVRFASMEDVIVHKIVAGRPRDLEDVRSILVKNPDVDLAYVRHWLGEFSHALAEPFLERFEQVQKDAS